jgi:hypothetical protein
MQTSNSSSRTLRILIAVCALITTAVHLILGIRSLPEPFGIVFILNAIGFAGLTILYLVPFSFTTPYHSIIRWGLIGFAGVTFILYFVINGLKIDMVSGITKLAELALIGLLMADRKQS